MAAPATYTNEQLTEDALASAGLSAVCAAAKEEWAMIVARNVRGDRERGNSGKKFRSRELCYMQTASVNKPEPRWVMADLAWPEQPELGAQTGLCVSNLNADTWKEGPVTASTFFVDPELLDLVKETIGRGDSVVAFAETRHGHCYVIAFVVFLKIAAGTAQ
jgi:hypothetical protein